MAGQTLSLIPSNASSAAFRAWGSAISTAIGVNGQVQTADTGQINWSTVTVPSASSSGGYEIWRFADALQATAPVYIKLEYGLQANSAPQIWLTVGTGSDGAGNLTGAVSGVLSPQITPRTACSSSGVAVSVATTSYVNGNSGCLAMLLFPNNNTAAWCGFMLLVERTKDGSGADTADGLVVLTATSSISPVVTSCFLTYVPGVRAAVSALTNNAVWPIPYTTFSSIIQTMTVAGVVYPAQVLTGMGPKAGGPSQYVTGVTIGDIAAGQTVAVSHYGTSRNWFSAGQGNTNGASGWGTIGNGDMVNIRSFLFRIN